MDTAYNNRILIIDDNATIHEDFRKVLNPKQASTEVLDLLTNKLLNEKTKKPKRILLEYEIDSAYQGKEGLSLVQKSLEIGRPYAMAFVDVLMPPGWDGIETIKQIWMIDPEIQITICTAYSDYSWEDIIRELGLTDQFLILKKPFDDIEIRQIACCLVKKWNLSQKIGHQYDHTQGLLHEQTKLTQEMIDENQTKDLKYEN